MKKKILLGFIVSSVLSLASYTVLKTSGSHPGSAGAPGDATCAQAGCHADAQVIQDNGIVNTLSVTSNDTTYIPGNTYTLTLSVFKSSIVKFGFELVALKDSNNTNVGTLSILETTRTQMLNYVSGTDLRYSVTHKTAGTPGLSPNSTQWKMKWTAPPINEGTITFYYASNCSNDNSFETGDRIYLSSFQIKPAKNLTTLSEFENNPNISVYFDKELKKIKLRFTPDRPEDIRILVFDVNGRLITEKQTRVQAGEQNQNIQLHENYSKGTYILKMLLGEKTFSTKILVD